MNMFYIFLASLGLNAFAIIIWAFYPASLKLAFARLMGKKYAFVLNKDRQMKIIPAKKKLEFYETKESVYELEPEDAFTYNGTSAGLWYESYNKATNPDILPFISKLKKMGIETLTELNLLTNTSDEDLLYDEEGNETEEGQELLDLKDKVLNLDYIKGIEVIRLRDMYGYLKARNPAAMKGYMEREVAKERYKHDNPLQTYFPYAIMAAIIIFALAIGYNVMDTGAVDTMTQAASSAGGSGGSVVVD